MIAENLDVVFLKNEMRKSGKDTRAMFLGKLKATCTNLDTAIDTS